MCVRCSTGCTRPQTSTSTIGSGRAAADRICSATKGIGTSSSAAHSSQRFVGVATAQTAHDMVHSLQKTPAHVRAGTYSNTSSNDASKRRPSDFVMRRSWPSSWSSRWFPTATTVTGCLTGFSGLRVIE